MWDSPRGNHENLNLKNDAEKCVTIITELSQEACQFW